MNPRQSSKPTVGYNYDTFAANRSNSAAGRDSRRQAKMIKHVKFAEIAGGPHGLCWTHADRVNAELVPFVAWSWSAHLRRRRQHIYALCGLTSSRYKQ